MNVLKFKPLKEQYEAFLDDSLIPFWHLIIGVGQSEYTVCGQAYTEYNYVEKYRRNNETN